MSHFTRPYGERSEPVYLSIVFLACKFKWDFYGWFSNTVWWCNQVNQNLYSNLFGFFFAWAIRFRKPNLELICVYAVQNPFLYGMYELRREQMKMQQESLQASLRTGLKERHFFYPTTFENLEAILRNNFNCGGVPNLGSSESEEHSSKQQQVKLYTTSDAANQAFEGNSLWLSIIFALTVGTFVFCAWQKTLLTQLKKDGS